MLVKEDGDGEQEEAGEGLRSDRVRAWEGSLGTQSARLWGPSRSLPEPNEELRGRDCSHRSPRLGTGKQAPHQHPGSSAGPPEESGRLGGAGDPQRTAGQLQGHA